MVDFNYIITFWKSNNKIIKKKIVHTTSAVYCKWSESHFTHWKIFTHSRKYHYFFQLIIWFNYNSWSEWFVLKSDWSGSLVRFTDSLIQLQQLLFHWRLGLIDMGKNIINFFFHIIQYWYSSRYSFTINGEGSSFHIFFRPVEWM